MHHKLQNKNETENHAVKMEKKISLNIFREFFFRSRKKPISIFTAANLRFRILYLKIFFTKMKKVHEVVFHESEKLFLFCKKDFNMQA
jgi:hypothetical protein